MVCVIPYFDNKSHSRGWVYPRTNSMPLTPAFLSSTASSTQATQKESIPRVSSCFVIITAPCPYACALTAGISSQPAGSIFFRKVTLFLSASISSSIHALSFAYPSLSKAVRPSLFLQNLFTTTLTSHAANTLTALTTKKFNRLLPITCAAAGTSFAAALKMTITAG